MKRQCPQCEQLFEPGRWEHRNYAQRFCCKECANEARSVRVRATWPAESDMRRMVQQEKLSDAQIGALYGKSYEWARRIRNEYRIPALPKPPHRTVTHGRYVGADKWGVRQKGETCCRACGAQPRADASDLRGRLHLHHVIPRSMCKATKTDLRNGIALCWTCHSGWHDRRVVIYRDVFTAGEWGFLTSVVLLGQEILPWLDAHYPDRGRPLRLGEYGPLELAA